MTPMGPATVAMPDLEIGRAPGAGPVEALRGRLGQLRAVVADLPDQLYRWRPESRVSGSIGGHVRHCLDHADALAAARPYDELSYDGRRRGTEVETSREAALDAIDRTRARLARLEPATLDRPVRIVAQLEAGGESVRGWSTLGRELAFVLHHTVHHQALIALLLDAMGRPVPRSFGYAPSTPLPPA